MLRGIKRSKKVVLRPLHRDKNHGPTKFYTATVRPKRSDLGLLYNTSFNKQMKRKTYYVAECMECTYFS